MRIIVVLLLLFCDFSNFKKPQFLDNDLVFAHGLDSQHPNIQLCKPRTTYAV